MQIVWLIMPYLSTPLSLCTKLQTRLFRCYILENSVFKTKRYLFWPSYNQSLCQDFTLKFFYCTHLYKTISGWRDHAFETFRVFCLHFERHPIWGLDWLCKQFHFLYKPIFDSSHHGLDSLAPFPRNFPQSLERQNPKPKVENIYLSFSGCLNNWLISRPICFRDLLTFDIKNFMNWIFAKLLSFFRSVCLVR